MTVLNRKLARDLWRMRGQAVAVAVVIACGLAVLIMSLGAVASLDETRAAFYERYRFADVFAQVRRAPETLRARIEAIPGVRAVQTRIVEGALLDLPGVVEPASAVLVSVPEDRRPRLNNLVLREGRWLRRANPDEVLVSEAFAEAHAYRPGDTITAIINGIRRELTIVGTALSPEYVYILPPGQLMPDDRRFGVLWMGRDALSAAFDAEGAFNDLTLKLGREAEPATVVERLDTLLRPYGGTGAYTREDQTSNWFLSGEIRQLRTFALMLPTIFIAVAAFLLNVAASRLVATERSQIGLLKAFGFSNRRIAWHYIKLVAAMAGLGVALGWLAGGWMGQWITGLYAQFFRFPFLIYRPDPGVFVLAAAIGLGAAALGAVTAVAQVARLAPAEAMQPPPPPSYHRTRLGRLLGRVRLDQPTLMILRHIGRWPLRSGLTTLGVALATGVLVLAMQSLDSIEELLARQFFVEQRHDAVVTFTDERTAEAVIDLEHLPGVLAAEPVRAVAARLRLGHVQHREALTGIASDARLTQRLDAAGRPLPLPPRGLMLSRALAEILGARMGDVVTVEVLEGRRPVLRLPVTAIAETYLGTPAWIDIDTLRRALGEGAVVSGAHLLVDSAARDEFYRAIKETPAVAGVMLRATAIDMFRATMGETMYIIIGFYATFAGLLTFGVVYNTARIALSERGRELASLRVLGFTTGEVSYILLGELAALTLLALPLGCVIGRGLAQLLAGLMETELYRLPVSVAPATYGFAVMVVLTATVLSALAVARRLRELDMVAVLKTYE